METSTGMETRQLQVSCQKIVGTHVSSWWLWRILQILLFLSPSGRDLLSTTYRSSDNNNSELSNNSLQERASYDGRRLDSVKFEDHKNMESKWNETIRDEMTGIVKRWSPTSATDRSDPSTANPNPIPTPVPGLKAARSSTWSKTRPNSRSFSSSCKTIGS